MEATEEAVNIESLQYAELERVLIAWNLPYVIEPEFPVNAVKTDGVPTQARELLHQAPKERVDQYIVHMRAGAVFPAIVVNKDYALIDGNTRLAASKRIGRASIPAIVVDAKTEEMARVLGASLNQMGGERLTPDEMYQNAGLMMDMGMEPEAISKCFGCSVAQVHRWRRENESRTRAERLDLGGRKLPKNAWQRMASITLDKPFGDLLVLADEASLGETAMKEIVDRVVSAGSEEEMVKAIADYRREIWPCGPPPHKAARSKIPLVHAACGNLLKFVDNPSGAFNPEQRDGEIARWEAVRKLAVDVIAAISRT